MVTDCSEHAAVSRRVLPGAAGLRLWANVNKLLVQRARVPRVHEVPCAKVEMNCCFAKEMRAI